MHSPLQLPQLQQESPQQMEYGNKNDSTSVDGYMYLPELRLFIDNPKDVVDVHALAGMNNAYIAFEPVSDGDVSVVIAPEERDCGHSVLVLIRFNESFHGGCTKLNDWQQHKLFEDVSKFLSHQGYECHRFGGSLRKTSLDKHFFKFLHKPTTFP